MTKKVVNLAEFESALSSEKGFHLKVDENRCIVNKCSAEMKKERKV